MQKIHRLTCWLFIFLVIGFFVSQKQVLLKDSIYLLEPMLHPLAATEIAIKDFDSFGPVIDDISSLFDDTLSNWTSSYELGGLQVSFAPVMDSAQLENRIEQKMETYGDDKSLARKYLKLEMMELYSKIPEQHRPRLSEEDFEKSVENVLSIGEQENCDGYAKPRFISLLVFTNGQVRLLNVSNAHKRGSCFIKGKIVAPVFQWSEDPVLDENQKRIVQWEAQRHGLVGDHWGAIFLKLQSLERNQITNIPLINLQVPLSNVYLYLYLVAIAVMFWIAITAKLQLLETKKMNCAEIVQYGTAPTNIEEYDFAIWYLEKSILGVFYSSALFAPIILLLPLIATEPIYSVLLPLTLFLGIVTGKRIVLLTKHSEATALGFHILSSNQILSILLITAFTLLLIFLHSDAGDGFLKGRSFYSIFGVLYTTLFYLLALHIFYLFYDIAIGRLCTKFHIPRSRFEGYWFCTKQWNELLAESTKVGVARTAMIIEPILAALSIVLFVYWIWFFYQLPW